MNNFEHLKYTMKRKDGDSIEYGGMNPTMGQVWEIKKYLFERMTESDWESIRSALLKECAGGNVKAMQLLFSYVLGKPVQTVDMNVTSAAVTPEEAKERINKFFGLGDAKTKRE